MGKSQPVPKGSLFPRGRTGDTPAGQSDYQEEFAAVHPDGRTGLTRNIESHMGFLDQIPGRLLGRNILVNSSSDDSNHSRFLQMLPKQVVANFYSLCFDQKQPRAAFERFVAETLIQHNPVVADGAEPALASLETHLRENPEIHFSIRRIVAEGDLVVVHALVKNDRLDRGRAVVDIFRVKEERIVEHWDVVQPMPDIAVNLHPMF